MSFRTYGFAVGLLVLLVPSSVVADTSASGGFIGSPGGYYPPVGPTAPPPAAHPVYPGPVQAPDAAQSDTYGLPEEEHHYPHISETYDIPHYPEARVPGLPSIFRSQPPVYPYNDPSLLALPLPFAKLTVLYKHLYSVIEPVFLLAFGIGVFLLVKNLVLPHLGHWYRSLDLEDEDERSLAKDRLTKTVLKAISKGVCMERLACQLGRKVKDYTLTDAVVRAIESTETDSLWLAAIFREAASGRVESCEPYSCWGSNRTGQGQDQTRSTAQPPLTTNDITQ